MQHPAFRIIRAEVPEDGGTLVWMVVGEHSVGPTILTPYETADLGAFLEELLKLIGHHGAELEHLHLHVTNGSDGRKGRAALIGVGRTEHELDLDEEQSDELETLLEAIAAFVQDHDEVAQGWQVAT